MIMIVAVAVCPSPPPQHSPKFGHFASSHTVLNLSSFSLDLIFEYFESSVPPGTVRFSHAGFLVVLSRLFFGAGDEYSPAFDHSDDVPRTKSSTVESSFANVSRKRSKRDDDDDDDDDFCATPSLLLVVVRIVFAALFVAVHVEYDDGLLKDEKNTFNEGIWLSIFPPAVTPRHFCVVIDESARRMMGR
tara:strand:- start:46 stop:612 length:567 start_codon:yes stop_codon:yes gene_type:complete